MSSNLLIPFVENINIFVPSKVTTELTVGKNKFKEREQKSYNEKLMVIFMAFVIFWETLLSKGKNCNPFSPLYNIYKLTQSNLCTTVTLRKWQGDRYIQGDCYIQGNFAENIRQLKIWGSCPVTVIYRLTTMYCAVI